MPLTLESLEADIKAQGVVTRAHLLQFLTLSPTSDAAYNRTAVRDWLTKLHNDPNFTTVIFPAGHIDRVVKDLDSYGRVQPETINEVADLETPTVTESAPELSPAESVLARLDERN